jgi:hypothetical protein
VFHDVLRCASVHCFDVDPSMKWRAILSILSGCSKHSE